MSGKLVSSTLQQYLLEKVFQSGAPRYIQLAQWIEEAISQKKVTGFLPSERDLAKLLQLSRVTVSHAFGLLDKKGLITRQQGLGTQINHQFDYSLNQLSGFTQRMTNGGFTVSDQWLSRKKIKANSIIAKQLAINENDEVAHLYRVRLIDNIPISIESTYIPICYLPEPENFSGSLYQEWDQQEIYLSKKTIHFSAISCDAILGKLLKQPINFPLLQIHEVNSDQHGNIIELSIVQCLSDYYAFKIEL